METLSLNKYRRIFSVTCFNVDNTRAPKGTTLTLVKIYEMRLPKGVPAGDRFSTICLSAHHDGS